MFALRYWSVLILVAAGALAFFVWTTTGSNGRFDFKLGLDLSGGTHLVYTADTSKISQAQINDSLQTLREVIERRVNSFGVSEPLVQIEQGGAVGGGEHRLIVELPGITDVDQAIKLIGQTPLLEFKLVKEGASTTLANGKPNPAAFVDTGLTGKYLSSAALQFGNGTSRIAGQPIVQVNFNPEGAKLFAQITADNVGKPLAIFLDNELVSMPNIQEKIEGGSAVISGSYTADDAKLLVRNLNLGALPVPITLSSTQTIGATLGDEALHAGLLAGIAGFVILAIFMILWYRLPGVIAVVALIIYGIMMLAVFKLIGVVLTAAGIAGFILSIGLAVDANVLIAERLKEELAAGKKADEAIREGFSRAWLAIRDSNIAHIISAVILYWFGTALIKGFALVFGLGVVISMISAISISRTFLLALGLKETSKVAHFLMRSGLRK
ncbi:protein translocase subunit SecD [Candidatus Parcubacteria bacterium]|nr:protein translocase subunit SecD [Candidatus Parcubacteria bacterium]